MKRLRRRLILVREHTGEPAHWAHQALAWAFLAVIAGAFFEALWPS